MIVIRGIFIIILLFGIISCKDNISDTNSTQKNNITVHENFSELIGSEGKAQRESIRLVNDKLFFIAGAHNKKYQIALSPEFNFIQVDKPEVKVRINRFTLGMTYHL